MSRKVLVVDDEQVCEKNIWSSFFFEKKELSNEEMTKS